MSYEIVYDKQFIKTRDDKFIPMAYWGSNNCYEYSGRRERSWTPFIPMNGEPLTKEEILGYWEGVRERKEEDGRNDRFLSYICLQIGNKYSYDQLITWLKNAMKKAITFEQLKEMGYTLRVEGYHEWEDRFNIEKTVDGLEPFSIYTDDEDEFLKYLKLSTKYKFGYVAANWGDNFAKYARRRYFPRAKRREKELKTFDHYFTIKIKELGYLVKHTSRGTQYAPYPYKRYATQKEAERLVKQYNKKYGYRKTYEVEKVDEPTNLFV